MLQIQLIILQSQGKYKHIKGFILRVGEHKINSK